MGGRIMGWVVLLIAAALILTGEDLADGLARLFALTIVLICVAGSILATGIFLTVLGVI